MQEFTLTRAEKFAIREFLEAKGLSSATAVTFGDVTLPENYSTVRSRSEINDFSAHLTPLLQLGIPLISANMESVTGAEMIIAVQREGGLGILPQTLPPDEKSAVLERVKRADCARIENPLTIVPEKTLREAKELMKKFKINGLVVIDTHRKPVGILSTRDWRYETDESKKIEHLMSRNLITAPENIDNKKAGAILTQHRIEKLPLVDREGRLAGLITAHGLFYHMHYPRALRDKNGQFIRVGSIGVGREFTNQHLDDISLQMRSGLSALLIDTARAFSLNTKEAILRIKKEFPNLALIVGNVSTPEGAKFLFEAGADIVKVGQGPGEACRTREVGIGIPQLTAIAQCSAIAKVYGKKVIADGGIKNPGDVAKAIIAGAAATMIGYLFASAEEAASPPYSFYLRELGADIRAKDYIGSASFEAQRRRSARGGLDRIRRAEGVKKIVPVVGPLSYRINELLDGLRSAMSYVGAYNLKELHEKGYFVPQTSAGAFEGLKR